MPPRADFIHEHLDSIDSTNAELMRRAASCSIHARALTADLQTAGRGQRGRHWHANSGDALLLSVGWCFERGERIEGLSLAVGTMVAQAAQRFASERIALKWPNDLLLDDRVKLGGILIETLPLDGERRVAVIGVGINVRPPTLGELTGGAAPDALPPGALLAGFQLRQADGATIIRDALRQSILEEFAAQLPEFAANGFAAFRDDWWSRRAYADRAVRVLAVDASNSARAPISGQIVDIDKTGALVINDGRILHTLHSGTLSIRPIHA